MQVDWREGEELSQGSDKDVIWAFVHNCLLLKAPLPLLHDLFHRTYSGLTFVFFKGQELKRSNPMI